VVLRVSVVRLPENIHHGGTEVTQKNHERCHHVLDTVTHLSGMYTPAGEGDSRFALKCDEDVCVPGKSWATFLTVFS